jgi:hypothetical protein
MTRVNFLVLTLTLTTSLAACGSNDAGGKAMKNSSGTAGSKASAKNSSGDGGVGAGGPAASVAITAAKGGMVVLDKASLNIPAGSLASDTTITLKTSAPGSDLPDSASVKGLIYDFGPDGTQFSEAAKLTLPSPGMPAADQEAVIAWLDVKANAWQDLATTVNADGSLSANVMHFTNFAVRFNGVVSSDCGFTACGGDVVGTWKVTNVCAEIAGSVIDLCPTAVAMLDLTLTGTATFKSDGTRSTDFSNKSTITYTLDAKCLDTITKGMPPKACDVLSKPADPTMDQGPTTCTGDPTVGCTCVEDDPQKTEMKTGTYVIDGNMMTSTDDADGKTTTAEFCVKGTGARFKQAEGLAVLTWIATKQ